MNAITYKTFAATVDQVHSAARLALARMRISVQADRQTACGHDLVCAAANRKIDVQLKALTPHVTRMRVVANDSMILGASISATDIVNSTADNLEPSWLMAANCN